MRATHHVSMMMEIAGLSQKTRGGNSKLNSKRRLIENFFSLEKTLHD